MERICHRDLCHLREVEGRSKPAVAKVEIEGAGEGRLVIKVHLSVTKFQIFDAAPQRKKRWIKVSGWPHKQLWGMSLELHFLARSPVKREPLIRSQHKSLYLLNTGAFHKFP